MNGTKSVDENFQNDRDRAIEEEMAKAGWDKKFKNDYLWYKSNPEDYEDYSI